MAGTLLVVAEALIRVGVEAVRSNRIKEGVAVGPGEAEVERGAEEAGEEHGAEVNLAVVVGKVVRKVSIHNMPKNY